MKNKRKYLAIILALAVAAAAFPVAYADTITTPVSVDATSESVTETINDNISGTVDNDNAAAISIVAAGGNSAEVNISGDVSSNTGETESANHLSVVSVSAEEGSSAELSITGDVNANNTQMVVMKAVSATADGENAQASVTVNGEIAVTYDLMDQHNYCVAANAENGAETSVYVNGNLTSGGYDAAGVQAIARGDESVATVQVDGNIDVLTEEGVYRYGTSVTAEDNGTVELTVNGNIEAGRYGIAVNADDSSTANVFVDGTVHGDKSAIAIDNPEVSSGITLTVWEIEPNNDNRIVETAKNWNNNEEETAAEKEKCDEIEKNILYIIRINDDAKGNVAFAGTVLSREYDCAREGETVTLRNTAGYRVVGADNNGTALMQDENGSYYLVVPRGGGVYLTVALEAIEVPATAAVSEAMPRVLLRLFAEDGTETRLYSNMKYTMYLKNGDKDRGRFEIKDGVLVFDIPGGMTVNPETTPEGNYSYTFTTSSGETERFTVTTSDLATLIAEI